VIARNEIWWADLPSPVGSAPGKRRPVLVVSADAFNRSRIGTVIAAVPAERSGLSKDSVVNVSQVVTIDKQQLTERVGALDHDTVAQVEAGLRLALDLAG
jgi:mRNA interferase MazF